MTSITLRPDGLLLNPDFDGYKLSLEPVPIFEKALGIGVDRVEPSSEQYSFQHQRVFSLHNHLICDPWKEKDVYYINEQWRVVRNNWQAQSRRFKSTEMWQIPLVKERKPGACNVSLTFPSSGIASLCDGVGTLYIIDTGDREKEVENKWKVVLDTEVCNGRESVLQDSVLVEQEGAPLQLHCLILNIVETISIPGYEKESKERGGAFVTLLHWLTFIIEEGKWCAQYQRELCVPGPVDYCAVEPGGRAVYVSSQKPVRFIADSEKPVAPPIEQAIKKPVNYIWDQSESWLTINLLLPQKASNTDVLVTTTQNYISVKCASKVLLEGCTSHNLDAENTKWSVDEGKLEIKLIKAEAGLEWEALIPGDPRGEKSLDPMEVHEVHKRLAHLCSETLEIGECIPGFNAQQLEDCDAPPADSTMLVRLDCNSHATTHRVQLSAHQWLFGTRLTPNSAPALVLRHDVDGLVWQPAPLGDDLEKWPVMHVGTFPAFGYVQASKEQRKFTVCPPDIGFAAVIEGSPHVYIYHQPAAISSDLRNRITGRRVASVARQQVARIPSEVKDILGACASQKVLFLLARKTLLSLPMADN